MRYYSYLISLLWLVLMLPLAAGNEDELLQQLQAIPGAEVEEIPPIPGYHRTFRIFLTQPLDHDNPAGKTFRQKIYLCHLNNDRPMVLGTEGYQVYHPTQYEISAILNANQLIVEHRFFNDSRPDSLDWQYLTIQQAADDHHRNVAVFKSIYPGKWINTGASKGGQTALFHRRFYPNDVDVTVAYVAPIPMSFTDPQLDAFLASVGDAACRDKIVHFQRLLLQHREEMLPLLQRWAETKEQAFSIGVPVAFEYAVLEYPFSFWQSAGSDCPSIPEIWGDPEAMFAHFGAVVPFSLYTDSGIARFRPFFYQAASELGYYGYRTEHLQDLLQAVPNPDNHIFTPPNSMPVYRPEVMQDIRNWLVHQGNNIIYIYGELDSWSGAGIVPGPETNALRMVNPGGHHATRIADFSPEDQAKIFQTLEVWLDMKVTGLGKQTGGGYLKLNLLFLLGAILITYYLFLRKRKPGQQ